MPIWMKKRNIIKHKNLFSYIKIEKEILAFGYIEIEKKSVFLRDTDTENVLLSNKISFGEKKTINTLLVTCMMTTKLCH